MRTLMRSGHLRLGFAHTTCHRGVRYHMDMPSGSCAGTRNRNRARRAAAIAHRPHRPESAKPRQGGYEPGKRYGEEPGSVSDFIDSYKYGRYIQLTPRGHSRYAYGVFRLSRAARDTKRAKRRKAHRSATTSSRPALLVVSAFAFRRVYLRRAVTANAPRWARDPKANPEPSEAAQRYRRDHPLPPATSHRSRHGTRTTRIKGRHSISHGDGGPTSG